MDAHAEPVSQGRGLETRVMLGLLLAAVSVALLALAYFGGATLNRSSAETTMYGSPILWVLAAIAFAPRILTRHVIALVAVAGYAVAFLLPAISRGDASYPGYVAFVAGVWLVPIAWLANPAFLGALWLYRDGIRGGAVVVGIVATLLALTALGMPNWNGWGPSIGFWAWALTPTVLAAAAFIAPPEREEPAFVPHRDR